MKKHWRLLSAIAIFFLILGILLDKWVQNWSFIILKFEVDVFAGVTTLLSIGVTLMVAYWVTTVLEKRNTDKRTEKDIIIKHIDLMYPIIEEARDKVRLGKINYSHAASTSKRILTNISTVVVCMVKASLETIDNHETFIQAEVFMLRDLMTNTVPNDLNLVVINGEINISSDRQLLIEMQMDKVRNEIFKLELSINNA